MIGRVVSHYEILAQIGKGGMGVVYEARDRNLDRLVALKFLPRELAESSEKKQRFLQEARAASTLDHANICTIHEIGETEDGQLFIAMAHYEGETLKEKLTHGPLPVPEILDIAEQLAAGLGAAHRRGLTHLDIKPANVLVTSKGAVKILDFGLAQFSGETPELSASGAVMGTVSYMAPERVLGQEVTPQADIWAMGAVLYEMATGQKPFQGLDKTEVLYAIVRDDLKPPGDLAEDLPPELDEIICRALTKEQDQRYKSLPELTQDLDELLQASRSADLAILPGRWWLRLGRPEASMAAAAAVVVFLIWWTFKALVSGPSELDGTSGVLFLGFDNRSGPQASWLAVALEESLLMTLPSGRDLQWMRAGTESFPLDGKTRRRLLSSLDPERGLVEKDLQELRATPARLLVAGTCHTGESGEIRTIYLVAQDLRLGTVAKQLSFVNQGERFPDLLLRLATPLAKAFGMNNWEPMAAQRFPPPDSKTAHLLFLGRGRMKRLNATAVREIFLQGNDERGFHAEVRLALVDALLELGHDQDAEVEARAGLTAGDLPLEIKARFTSRLLEARGETARAAALLRAFWVDATASKDTDASEASFEEGYHLAGLLVRSGQAAAAEEVTAQLWARAPSDPRLALLDAERARHHSLFEQQEKAAQMALNLLHDGEGLPLVRARALLAKGLAHVAQEKLVEAEAVLLGAHELYEAQGVPIGVAKTLTALAGLDLAHHDLEGAKERYETSIRLCEALGNRQFLGWPLAGRAWAAREGGDLPGALEGFRQSLNLLEGAVDPLDEAKVLLRLGESATATGRLQEAEQAIRRVLFLLGGDPEHPRYEAEALSSLGELQLLRGDLLESDHTLTQALVIQRRIGDRQGLALTLSRHGWLYHRRGQLSEARSQHQEAVTVAAESGDTDLRIRCRQGLAATLLASGEIAEARSLLAKARSEIDTTVDPLLGTTIRLAHAEATLYAGFPAEAEAEARNALDTLGSSIALVVAEGHRVLAECLLPNGRLEEARQNIDSALAKLPEGIATRRLRLKLVQAKILRGRGEVEPARQILAELLATATTGGFAESELEAQLALALIDLATGPQRSARSHLHQIEQEATLKGFLRIAAEVRRNQER